MKEKQKFLILDQVKFLRKNSLKISQKRTSTRRDALKKMSMLAFTMHPVMKAVDKAITMPFMIHRKGRAVCFSFNNELAWEINPVLFGRNAEVLLTESDNGFDILLKNAEYPSTGIRADFHAVVRRKEAEWIMDIEFPWLNISERISFDRWLRDNVCLNGIMTSGIKIPLGKNDSVSLPSSSVLRLDRRWNIDILPEKEIVLNIFNGNESYKGARLSVYKEGTPEWINTTHFSDTLFLSLNEPQSDFSSFGSLRYRSHTAFGSSEYPFSRTGVVAGRHENNIASILWACNDADSGNSSTVLRPQGGKTALSFTNTRFSKEYTSDMEPFMFAGDIGSAPQWIGTAGAAFAIASSPDYSFLIRGEGNEISFLDLKARLLQSMITINGCSSLPAVYSNTPGVNLSFQDQRAVKLQKPVTGQVVNPANVQRVDDQDERAGWIYVNREATRVRFRTDTPILFNIIRPNDFLNLQLEFVNFILDGNLLKIDDAKSPSFLIVHFPSQHTREEMFKASEKPRVPVKFLRAKSSRLVFRVPSDNEPIPLTLEYLLNWDNFEIQVNYRARWFNTGRDTGGLLQQNLQKMSMVYGAVSPGKGAVAPRKALNLQIQQKKVITPAPLQTKQIQQPMTAQEVKVAVSSSPKGPGRLSLSDESVVKVLANPELETTMVDQVKGALANLFKMGEPSKYETSIEAPAWMEISPNQFAGFAHNIELRDEFGEYDESKPERLDISDDIATAPGKREVSPAVPENRAQVKRVLPAQMKVAPGTQQIRTVQPIIIRNPKYKNVVSPSLLKIPPLLAIKQGQLFELWHTRMGVKLASGEIDEDALSDLKTVRVLWSPCASEKPGGQSRAFIEASKNFYSLPEPYQINELVHLTSNYTDLRIENTNTKADPRPVKAKRLMLSALGAWFDYEFRDERRINSIALQAWLQRATMGRDHYIKLVMRGYLFPFGHKAVRIIIGERKIQLVGNVYTAVVIVKEYIVVTQPELLYGRTAGNQGFVPFPFQRVEIKDLEKQVSTKQIITGQNAFELYEVADTNKPLFYKIEMDDAVGQTVRTEVPVVFVEANVTQQSVVVDHYAKNGWDYFSSGPASKPVAYARSLVPGDTMLETRSIMFGARNINYDLDGVKFYPEVVESSVFIKQVEELTGERKPVRIQLMDDNNLSMVFAKVHPDEKAELVFGDTETSGGFLSPNMAITGFSKLTGLTGSALDNLNNLMVVAEKIFSIADKIPKIFGVINFVDILMPEVNLTGAVSKIKDQIEKIRDQIESVSQEILSVLARADAELKRLNRFLTAVSGLLENRSITEALKDSEALAQALSSYGITVSQGTIKEALEAAISAGREINAKNVSLATLAGYIDNPAGLRTELTNAGADVSSQTVARLLELVKGLLNNGFEDSEIIAVVNVLGLVSSLTDLQSLIKTLAGDIANRIIESIPEMPNIKFQIKGDEIVVEYHWKPKTKNEFDAVLFQIKNMNSSTSQIEVSVDSTMKKSIDLKSPPRFDVDASIKKFSIVVAKTIQINFEKLAFKSGTGSKPDVDLKFSPVPIRLIGSLSFVNNLQKVLNADQFAAGPFIDVSTNGIVAGYNFPLPNIEVGILALSNMMLGTRLKIPFNQDALTLGFNFSSRENPFKVLVSCFGGGGFFSMETTMKGLRRLDAAFEFGAGVSLNLGVASGSVEAMGGIYYCLVTEPEGTTYSMTAYLRLTGRLSILKLIKVTLEFYLELLYESLGEKTIMEDNKPVLKVDRGSRLVGTATLSVKVEVLFFSKTVKVTVKRTFSGNDADPKFADTYSLEHWQSYCAAFAS